MKRRLPSPALVIACLALLLAAGGVSYATVKVTGSAVNIVDGTTASRIAHVDATGKLEVGDGSGPLTVNGGVLAAPAAPASLFRVFGVPTASCSPFYTVPAGKALILTSMTVFSHSASAGSNTELDLFASGCSDFLGATVSDRAHETITQSFGTGIALPTGTSLAFLGINQNGSAYVYGYLVPASQVPATSADSVAGPAWSGGPATTASR
jgi:hypothetical protein